MFPGPRPGLPVFLHLVPRLAACAALIPALAGLMLCAATAAATSPAPVVHARSGQPAGHARHAGELTGAGQVDSGAASSACRPDSKNRPTCGRRVLPLPKVSAPAQPGSTVASQERCAGVALPRPTASRPVSLHPRVPSRKASAIPQGHGIHDAMTVPNDAARNPCRPAASVRTAAPGAPGLQQVFGPGRTTTTWKHRARPVRGPVARRRAPSSRSRGPAAARRCSAARPCRSKSAAGVHAWPPGWGRNAWLAANRAGSVS